MHWVIAHCAVRHCCGFSWELNFGVVLKFRNAALHETNQSNYHCVTSTVYHPACTSHFVKRDWSLEEYCLSLEYLLA